MINGRMQDALNGQVNAEMYSAYLYLSMSAYFASVNLGGFAKWMRVQAQEEMVHALKLYDHVTERGGRNVLAAIKAPPVEWDSPLAAFEAVYAHERKVTGLINALVDLANEQADDASASFLHWFVTEQVEEEASADKVVQRLKLIGDSKQGVVTLDHEMGTRVFTPPATAKEGGLE